MKIKKRIFWIISSLAEKNLSVAHFTQIHLRCSHKGFLKHYSDFIRFHSPFISPTLPLCSLVGKEENKKDTWPNLLINRMKCVKCLHCTCFDFCACTLVFQHFFLFFFIFFKQQMFSSKIMVDRKKKKRTLMILQW